MVNSKKYFFISSIIWCPVLYTGIPVKKIMEIVSKPRKTNVKIRDTAHLA